MSKNIHDYKIISYNVNFNSNEIIFNASSYEDKNIIITFKEVLVHSFKIEMPNSIILDIEKFNIEKMIEENKELLEENKNYCWPILYDNMDELAKKLKNYNYYTINSSYGLCGWILAKELEVNTNMKDI